MEYRNKEEASKCRYLKNGRGGVYINGPVTLEFVCENTNVKGKFVQAQFNYLDICCVCKYFEKVKKVDYVCTQCGHGWNGEWAEFCPVCESELIKQKPVDYDPADHK